MTTSFWNIDGDTYTLANRKLSSERLTQALNALPEYDVKTLDLGGTNLTVEHMQQLAAWRGIEMLEALLLGFAPLNPDYLAALVADRPLHDLYHVELSGIDIGSRGSEVAELLSGSLPALEQLDLAFTMLADELLAPLQDLVVLDLSMSHGTYRTLQVIGTRGSEVLLEELYAVGCPSFARMSYLLNLHRPRRCRRLHTLDVRGCNINSGNELNSYLSERDLKDFFEFLEVVRLEGNPLDQSAMEKLEQVAPHLVEYWQEDPPSLHKTSEKAINASYKRDQAVAGHDYTKMTKRTLKSYLKDLGLSKETFPALERWHQIHG